MEEHTSLSLVELNMLVRRSVRACLPDEYWVQAELSDVRSNYSGHCIWNLCRKTVKAMPWWQRPEALFGTMSIPV